MSIHIRIRQRRKELKLTQSDIAKYVGVSRVSVTNWESDGPSHTNPKGQNLVKLSEKLKVTPDWILSGKGDPTPANDDVKNKPIKIVTDDGDCVVVHPEVFKTAKVNIESACGVKVPSSYMEPMIPEGTVVLIDTKSKAVKDRDIYAIRVAGNLHVKMLQRTSDGKLMLKNFNPAFPDEEFTREQAKEIEVLGRVFWWSVVR